MKLGLFHREEIRNISPLLEDEFDRLMAAISQTFLREHDWEGRHTDVNAISVRQRLDNTQSTTPSVDGAGSVTSDLTQDLFGLVDITVVKSIQRGTITISASGTSGTATITAVDIAKSNLTMLGFATASTDSNPSTHNPRIALTNATTITATCTSAAGGAIIVSYEIVEFY